MPNVVLPNIFSQKRIYIATSYRLLQETSVFDVTLFFIGGIQ